MASLRERKRDHFVHSALELFESKGFEETTIDEIAERAMQSRSTFFRHFGTKEDVLFAGLAEFLELLRETLARELEVNPPWEAVTNAVRVTSGGFLEQDPEHATRLLKLWMTVPALRARYMEHADRWERAIVEAVTAAEGNGPATATYAAALAVATVGAFRVASESVTAVDGDVLEKFEATLALMGDGLATPPRKRWTTKT
jgi:AcrR family transcriptional regulator